MRRRHEERKRDDRFESWPERRAAATASAEPEVEEQEAAEAEAEAEAEPEVEEAPEQPQPEERREEAPRQPEHAAGGLDIPDDVSVVEGEAKGGLRPVAIVVSRFNGEVTGRLLERALEELEELGVGRSVVTVMPVPGAFELPLAAMALAKTRKFVCVVALGCVIRGETPHFDLVAGEAASGLQLAALETGVPVAFGVLTCDSRRQAEERAGGEQGNKGAEAARTALEMADAMARLRASVPR
jgi:6,7-dimethyl-8-ribityllumazine synthase